MQKEEEIAKQALAADWDINLADVFTEEAIIEKLSLQIGVIAEKGPDVFFQLMYRLDIPEKLLVNAMTNKETAREIAKLIYNRQLQKIRSRAFYKNKPNADEDIVW